MKSSSYCMQIATNFTESANVVLLYYNHHHAPLQTNDQSSSAVADLRQLQQQPVEESATSSSTVFNNIAASSVSIDDDDGHHCIVEEDDSKIEEDYLNTFSKQQPEFTTLLATDVETGSVDDNLIVALAAASDPVVMRSVEEELSLPAEAAVLVAAAAAVNDELNAQPKFSSSSNYPTNVDDEKCELELKEEKDDSNIIFGADLILVNFESSLIHAQSHIETIILRDTFIGPLGKSHHHSSSNEESSINIEYHGDNVVGCFDGQGNHAIGSSSHRRLYGPVYTVRKYQPATDVEMVYAVIIWADASVKDKVEIEIASLDDYFELLSKS